MTLRRQSGSATGPVISTVLYDVATKELRMAVEQDLASQASKVANDWARRFEVYVRNAYIAGLRDGFAQGVYAQHDGDGDGPASEGFQNPHGEVEKP